MIILLHRDFLIQLLLPGIAVLILAFLRSQFILQTSILRTIELSMFLTELMYVLISFNCWLIRPRSGRKWNSLPGNLHINQILVDHSNNPGWDFAKPLKRVDTRAQACIYCTAAGCALYYYQTVTGWINCPFTFEPVLWLTLLTTWWGRSEGRMWIWCFVQNKQTRQKSMKSVHTFFKCVASFQTFFFYCFLPLFYYHLFFFYSDIWKLRKVWTQEQRWAEQTELFIFTRSLVRLFIRTCISYKNKGIILKQWTFINVQDKVEISGIRSNVNRHIMRYVGNL